MRRALAAALLFAAVTGCGYRFTAGGAPLPEGVRTVCAPIFANRTAEPALELIFTDALRERLLRAGALSTGACDARLEGEVLGVGSAPTIQTTQGTLAAYRISASARLRLLKGERVLAETELSGNEDYLPGADLRGDVLQTEASRQAALQRLAEALMKDAYDRLANGW